MDIRICTVIDIFIHLTLRTENFQREHISTTNLKLRPDNISVLDSNPARYQWPIDMIRSTWSKYQP